MPLNWRLAAPELALPARGRRAGAPPRRADEHAELAAATRHERRAARSAELDARERKPSVEAEAGDDDPLLLVYTSGHDRASRRARCSRTRTASGRTSRFDRATGLCATTTSCSRCCRSSTSAAGTCSRCSRGGRARRSCSSRRSTRRARSQLIAREARDDDDGRARDLPLHGAGSRLRERRPLEPAARGRRRRADARGAARDVARARRRDRPGLRPDRGGAERALPAARGRGAQARLRRQAVPARRRRAARPRDGRAPRRRGRRASSSSAGRTSSPATGATTRRRRPPSRTAGCSPATSPSATTRATTGSSGGLKDMVISGGENVYPAEIENVLHEHPAVAEAAVVGVPDERWGEACVAFVVLRPARRRREEELLEHCRGAARALQGAEARPLRRRAAAHGDGQGPQGRAARAVARLRDERGRRRASTGGRSRSAASARASKLLEAAERSSPSSATTTPRS